MTGLLKHDPQVIMDTGIKSFNICMAATVTVTIIDGTIGLGSKKTNDFNNKFLICLLNGINENQTISMYKYKNVKNMFVNLGNKI